VITPGTTHQSSDPELIEAMNAGDDAAFDLLYHRYRDWIFSLAWRFTGCNSLANDVLQETFLYFLSKFPGFVLTSQLKTFLYPAVRNRSLDAIKKTSRFRSTVGEQDLLHALPATAGRAGGADDLHAVLGGLSEDHREILMLRFVDGLALEEIAEAASIPVGTVKSRLHHALSRLRSSPEVREFFFA
jgi:RNA polymerase sigma-70 factor (ECF subfamily)